MKTTLNFINCCPEKFSTKHIKLYFLSIFNLKNHVIREKNDFFSKFENFEVMWKLKTTRWNGIQIRDQRVKIHRKWRVSFLQKLKTLFLWGCVIEYIILLPFRPWCFDDIKKGNPFATSLSVLFEMAIGQVWIKAFDQFCSKGYALRVGLMSYCWVIWFKEIHSMEIKAIPRTL